MIQFYAKVDKRGLKVHLKVSKPIVIGGNSVNFTYKTSKFNHEFTTPRSDGQGKFIKLILDQNI